MLLKLIKYDLKSMLKIMMPLFLYQIILTLTTLLMVIVPENIVTNILGAILVVLLIISFIAILTIGTYIGVYRFYKSILKQQGYLTNTLPVKKSRILLSIILSSLIIILITILVSLILGCLTSYFKFNSWFLFDISAAIFTTTGFTFIIFSIVAFISSLLFYICALSIGHSYSSSKLLYSVLYAVLIYIFNSIVLAILLFGLDPFLSNNPSAGEIDVIRILILYQLIYAVILFIITNYTLKNKLNLE